MTDHDKPTPEVRIVGPALCVNQRLSEESLQRILRFTEEHQELLDAERAAHKETRVEVERLRTLLREVMGFPGPKHRIGAWEDLGGRIERALRRTG